MDYDDKYSDLLTHHILKCRTMRITYEEAIEVGKFFQLRKIAADKLGLKPDKRKAYYIGCFEAAFKKANVVDEISIVERMGGVT